MWKVLIICVLAGSYYWIKAHPDSQAAQTVNQAWAMVKAEWDSINGTVRNELNGGIRLSPPPVHK